MYELSEREQAGQLLAQSSLFGWLFRNNESNRAVQQISHLLKTVPTRANFNFIF